MKENEITIFKHNIHKIEEKSEFIPSYDVNELVPQVIILLQTYYLQELRKTLDDLDTNTQILYSFETKICAKMTELYQKIAKDKLKVT